MTQPREALLARFRAGLLERVRATQRLVDAFQQTKHEEDLRQALGELHTLKGESRMLGLGDLSELAHALETELGTTQRFGLALAAFRRCRELLSIVLGVKPSAETDLLSKEIAAGAFP